MGLPLQFETARLRLRPAHVGDAQTVARINAGATSEFWSPRTPKPTTTSAAMQYCIAMSRRKGYFWMIEDAGGLCGGIEVSDAVYFWLAKEQRGRRYINEAIRPVLRAVFAAGRPFLDAYQYSSNVAAGRVIDEIGFKLTDRDSPYFQDETGQGEKLRVYRLTAQDWADQHDFPTLRTARLLTRPWRDADAPTLRAFAADPVAVASVCDLGSVVSDATAKAQIDKWAWTGGADFQIAITRFDDVVVGTLGADASGWVTSYLHPDYWGVGLTTELLQQALPILVDKFGHASLMAGVPETNPHFARILAKLGFEKADIGTNAAPATLEPAPAILYRLSSTAALTA